MSYYSRIKLEDIIKEVNSYFGLEIRSKSRKKEYVIARNVFYFLAMKYTNYTCTEISLRVNKGHSSIIHGIKTYYKEETLINHHTKAITDELGLTKYLQGCIIG